MAHVIALMNRAKRDRRLLDQRHCRSDRHVLANLVRFDQIGHGADPVSGLNHIVDQLDSRRSRLFVGHRHDTFADIIGAVKVDRRAAARRDAEIKVILPSARFGV